MVRPWTSRDPGAVVPVSRVPREAEDQSTVFRAGIFLLGGGPGRLPFRKEVLWRTSVMSRSVSGQAHIPSALVPVTSCQKEGEDEQ